MGHLIVMLVESHKYTLKGNQKGLVFFKMVIQKILVVEKSRTAWVILLKFVFYSQSCIAITHRQ